MDKNIRVKLNGNEENLDFKCVSKINNNKIFYQENDISVIVEKCKDRVILIRKHNDYEIKFNFSVLNDQVSTYNVFGSNKDFILDIVTTKLEIDDNKIYIEYKLEEDLFKFSLEVL